MKKALKVFLVATVLTISSVAMAAPTCLRAVINCGDGTGTIAIVCGETTAQIVAEALEIADAVCE
ncbi:MAG: hypothetical protein CVU09_06770 [Bacteroidetes bacterium HGW-Bacteroidetes-4]|jgi:hypothetical protein|nr:MAG: hypothetical protein CVU09_06770 [Bacteroidetes bacterium HGW-Bacteroidetes-4]